jgi:hypothetical protein
VAKRTAVGLFNPEKTGVELKPAAKVGLPVTAGLTPLAALLVQLSFKKPEEVQVGAAWIWVEEDKVEVPAIVAAATGVAGQKRIKLVKNTNPPRLKFQAKKP